MRILFISIIFSFLPILFFAQANSDYKKIKKEKIREVKLYSNKKDSFPDAALYYDLQGRLRKWVSILDYGEGPPYKYEIYVSEFDTLGRMVKSISTFCTERNIDDAVFIHDDDFLTIYSYSGDSSVIEMDSAWENKRVVQLRYDKTIIHWQKTSPPFPRPILWQDSIESSFIEIRKNYNFYYQSEISNEPVKVDSTGYEEYEQYKIENGKLIGTGNYIGFIGDTITNGDSKKIYTLNQKYDTVTWINNSKKVPASKADIINHSDNYHYYFMRTLETKRAGKKFIIQYSDYDPDTRTKNKKPEIIKAKTKYPWNDYNITSYFADEGNFCEDWNIENAASFFGAPRVEKIKY